MERSKKVPGPGAYTVTRELTSGKVKTGKMYYQRQNGFHHERPSTANNSMPYDTSFPAPNGYEPDKSRTSKWSNTKDGATTFNKYSKTYMGLHMEKQARTPDACSYSPGDSKPGMRRPGSAMLDIRGGKKTWIEKIEEKGAKLPGPGQYHYDDDNDASEATKKKKAKPKKKIGASNMTLHMRKTESQKLKEMQDKMRNFYPALPSAAKENEDARQRQKKGQFQPLDCLQFGLSHNFPHRSGYAADLEFVLSARIPVTLNNDLLSCKVVARCGCESAKISQSSPAG
jgi:hypothetical protein